MLLHDTTRIRYQRTLAHCDHRLNELHVEDALLEAMPRTQAIIRHSIAEHLKRRQEICEILQADQAALRKQRAAWVDEMIESGQLGRF